MNASLDSWTNIIFPIIILIMVTLLFVWYIRQIQKDKLMLSKTFSWIIFSILFWIIGIYMLVITSLRVVGYKPYDILDRLASSIGFNYVEGHNWLILVVLLLIVFIYLRLFRNTIKISTLSKRVDALNREVAIMNGKVNKTVEFEMAAIIHPNKTLKEIRKELAEKVKIEKTKLVAKSKILKVKEKSAQLSMKPIETTKRRKLTQKNGTSNKKAAKDK